MSRTSTALAVAAAAVTGALVVGTIDHADPAPRRVVPQASVDPGDFAHPRANPWYPLTVGLTVLLRGTDEGVHYRERVRVTGRTKVIEGVRTHVVRDVLRRADGSLAERTSDWYAADDLGNVWYFGERTATYDRHGHVESREGSWQAGVHGAVAGLIMPADPQATDAYRQEYLRGHAEDQAWIVGFRASLRTPARRYRHVLRTFEWSRLEPGVVSAKLYARGVGIVAERDLSGGSERFTVVAVHRP